MIHKQKHTHIIWDWNGTLLDDVWLNLEILNPILIKHRCPTITESQYRTLFDFPVKNFYEKLGMHDVVLSFDELCSQFNIEMNKRRYECSLFFNVPEVLTEFKNNGLTQSILSLHPHDSLKELIHYYKIQEHFIELVGANNLRGESKIDQGKAKVQRLSIDPSEIVVVGDTVHDYEVAEAIGASCILLSHGYHSKDRLRSCNTPIADSLDDLKDIISNISETFKMTS